MRGKNILPKIMVSACLLGEPARYDGGNMKVHHPVLEGWIQQGLIISFCPEVEGGLTTPRPPAEIINGDGTKVLDGDAKVLDINGLDVTQLYKLGAQKALRAAQKNDVRLAILKAQSPSCGNRIIYDGTFSMALKPGKGVTVALLERNGIRVFNEDEIDAAADYLTHLNLSIP
jgi:uncharacterized protein YbbK (DUF523 family)